MRDKLATVMATFNGAKFIEQQVYSIFAQDYDGDMKLFVHDDGSTDRTLDILKKLSEKFPIELVLPNEKLGVQKGFLKSLETIMTYKPDYIFLADQDDVWNENKVQLQIDSVENKENPTMVFTNYDLIDENGRTIKKNAGPKLNTGLVETSMYNLLFNPIVTGNNVMMTGSFLMELAKNELLNANKISMHDHLISLHALETGNLFYLNVVTVQYRQHSHNVVGAGRQSIWKRFSKKSKSWINLSNSLEMIPLFRSVEPLSNKNFFSKIHWLVKHRISKNSFVNTLGSYFYILFLWQ